MSHSFHSYRKRTVTAVLSALLAFGVLPTKVTAQNVYTVTSVVDDADPGSAGTIRRAINDANAHQNAQGVPDVIVFDIPGAGVHTITLSSDLPAITEGVHIDGTTQLSAGGMPLVKVDGAGASQTLAVQGDNTTIESLIIVGSDAQGIVVFKHASHQTHGSCTIRGNYIGIDEAGASDPNSLSGVEIDDVPDCRIENNVVSGNSDAGITIGGPDATGNVVVNNRIGTNAAGVFGVGNASVGVSIVEGAFGNAVRDNVISDNADSGILLDGGSGAVYGNTIAGNTIGLGGDGTTVIGNGSHGVEIVDGADENTVGGSSPDDRNVIAGNFLDGIHIDDADGNVVVGNYIGTDATGLLDRGNIGYGVEINGADDTVIGGTSASERNVVAGNDAAGVRIIADAAGETTTGNLVRGNYIGAGADGSTAIGQVDQGVYLVSTVAAAEVSMNQIGGTEPGAGNVIANNGGIGVQLEGDDTIDNAILGNAIYLNGGRGIALEAGGVPVDPKDTDVGANDLQNYPSLAPWTVDAATNVTGVLNSRPSSNYRIEFFSTPYPEPSGHGEGETFLGSALVTTDVNGDAVFSAALPAVDTTDFLTATATEWVAGGPRSTSEFSQAVGIVGSGGVLMVNTNDGGAGDGSCDALDGLGADCSLLEAVDVANATIGVVETIRFDIPGATPAVISVTTAIPEITDPVIIDATPNGACDGSAPVVRLDNGAAILNGLHISAGQSTVRGLSVTGFDLSGLWLIDDGENVIECNYVGVAPDGVTDDGNAITGINVNAGSYDVIVGGATPEKGNLVSANGTGIRVTSGGAHVIQHNFVGTNADGDAALPNTEFGILVGGTGKGSVVANNVVSGNTLAGISISSAETVVTGNLVGTDAAGTAALANGDDGVFAGSTVGVVIGGAAVGDRNVLSGNGASGVAITGCEDCQVKGNYIGTDITGTAAIPNGDHGVLLSFSSLHVAIGGAGAHEGNLISGNAGSGVMASGTFVEETTIEGNLIGTDHTGTVALPNLAHGVVVSDDAGPTYVGGTASGAGNVISGNAQGGILLEDVDGGDGTYIFGNAIGTQIDGAGALGNDEHGIRIANSTNTYVGGTTRAKANIIAYNAEDGVNVSNDASDANPIRGNSIFLNGGLGIELEDHVTHNGLTANDAGDGDDGPNEEQNFPVISTADMFGGAIAITGLLSTSVSAGPYRLEFFASPSIDANGYGEGRVYLGSTSVTTDAGGVVSFSATLALPSDVSTGDFITATATDPDGNTSEFGLGYEATGSATTNIALTCPLGPGWNWFSINVTPTATDVNSVLDGLSVAPTENVDIVVDPADGFAMYSGGTWAPGTLDIKPGKAYKIFLTSGSDLDVTGPAATGSITLVSGFNWIGMNAQTTQPIGTALANANLTNGDLLASQSAFSIYSSGSWVGGVATLDPCEGYRLQADAGTAGFTYPKRAASRWSVNPAAFQDAMYVIGEIDGAAFGPADRVVAFVDGEVRGAVAPSEVNGRRLFFLTIHGNDDRGSIHFKQFDAASDALIDLDGRATFVADGVLGTVAEPLKWSSSPRSDAELPTAYALAQNFPNPFNPETRIAYEIPEAADVSLAIYDVRGRLVRTLVETHQAAGRHAITWDARDDAGTAVASGVYLYRIRTHAFSAARTLVLMK